MGEKIHMSKKIRSLVAVLILSIMIATESTMVLADSKSDILEGRQEIKSISREIRNTEEKISRLDNDLIKLTLEIQENEEELETTREDISETKLVIEAKKEERDDKQEQYGKRLRSAYKDGGISWIEALLNSDSLSDFFLKTKVIRSIAESDQEIMSELDRLNEELTAHQTELEGQKLATEKLLSDLENQDEELNASLGSQKENLAFVEARKAELTELIKGKELELFAEVRDIFNDPSSTISDVTDARTILASLESFVQSQEAIALAVELDDQSNDTLKELKAEEARRAAEEAARKAEEARLAEIARVEAEEAARKAEADRQAAAERKAAEEATRRAEAERKAAEEAARRAAVTQPAKTNPAPEKTEEKKPDPVKVSKPSTNTSKGERALAEARKYLGVPYVYGGASFRGVDCSGLTLRAYAAAGISLSHSANAQYRASRRISRSDLKPGDLIFWGYRGEITHVGIYAGNGKQIHAPRPGQSVCLVPLSTSMDYIGAGRPY